MTLQVKVKTVKTPFSFFCIIEDEGNSNFFKVENNSNSSRIDFSDVNHGQYVAVLWGNKWTRGIISMESQFLIWLVDHGIFIRPSDSTVYVNLPAEYKKIPTKVFEASIHGVTPVGMVLDDFFEFHTEATQKWSLGAIEKAQALIAGATKTYFVPIAMLTTQNNDVILGDLYLESKDKSIVNIIDELNHSPAFMERNKESYIENLANIYTSRRHHRACLLKPEMPIKCLPTMTVETTLEEYISICEKTTPFHTEQLDSDSDSSSSGSSVTFIENLMDGEDASPNKSLKLTPAEIEKYSNEFIIVAGREYNLLTVLINKARDLYICERYKNAKSVGRATTRIGSVINP